MTFDEVFELGGHPVRDGHHGGYTGRDVPLGLRSAGNVVVEDDGRGTGQKGSVQEDGKEEEFDPGGE